jgi:hypothetical protein
MKTLATTIMLVFTVSLAHGAEPSIKDAWSKEYLSPEERTALVERSKKEPFATIAPILLRTLVDNQMLLGYCPWGDTPWNNDRLRPTDRTYLMASVVWQQHMKPRDDLEKAPILLSLLQNASRQNEKSILIGAIKNSQWCTEAEKVLLAIAKDKKEDLGIRRASVSTLLIRCEIDIYMPLAIEIILSHDKGMPRNQAFNFTINQGNRLFSLSEENRRLVLATGFEVLTDWAENELQHGYFVARQLGFILKIRDEFAPNQKKRKYQGEHGLTDEFFIDTVKNALRWYSKNKKDIESN